MFFQHSKFHVTFMAELFRQSHQTTKQTQCQHSLSILLTAFYSSSQSSLSGFCVRSSPSLLLSCHRHCNVNLLWAAVVMGVRVTSVVMNVCVFSFSPADGIVCRIKLKIFANCCLFLHYQTWTCRSVKVSASILSSSCVKYLME